MRTRVIKGARIALCLIVFVVLSTSLSSSSASAHTKTKPKVCHATGTLKHKHLTIVVPCTEKPTKSKSTPPVCHEKGKLRHKKLTITVICPRSATKPVATPPGPPVLPVPVLPSPAGPKPPVAPIPSSWPPVCSTTGGVEATGTPLTLVPAAQTDSEWLWDGASPQVPLSGGSDIFGYAKASGDLWNTDPSADGEDGISIADDGTLQAGVNFSSTPPLAGSNTLVRGYPDVEVGANPFTSISNSPPAAPQLSLPEQVSGLQGLSAEMSYSISADPSTAYDWAYDLWLDASPTIPRSAGTQQLEMMVWTDYSTSPAITPPGYETTIEMPVTIDGTTACAAWQVYLKNDAADNRTTAWFVLTSPLSQGDVQLDLKEFIEEMGAALTNYAVPGWGSFSINDYYLDAVDLGSEFGPSTATSSDPTALGWSLNNYSLTP